MERLVRRELLNAGLVRLTPHLVERYNRCLESMGLPPSDGDLIEIDGVGMSPQVAAQRGISHYLCNGLANPLALIVSPEQYRKPVYFPIYSWQRPLMRAFFDKYHRQIIDITGTHAISVELENGISTFEVPEDLLLLTEIKAIPHMEDLTDAATHQSALVADFSQELNCLDESLCDKIIVSRKSHGDLRNRRITMEPMTFTSFADFYTVAFGGAAVLRDVKGVDFLILESEAEFAKVKTKRKTLQTFCLFDSEFSLFDALLKAEWIWIPEDHYRSDPRLLEFKKELLIADALCDCEGDINWRKFTKSARKALLQKHEERVPKIYFELERYAAKLRSGKTSRISSELAYFLAEPSSALPPQTQDVVTTLLTHREPRNLLALYTVDKNMFLVRYNEWSGAKREWAVGYLGERYTHMHRLPKTEQ